MDGLERQQFIREQHERVLAEARATLERLDWRDLRPRGHGADLRDVLEDPVAKWAREGHELERKRSAASRRRHEQEADDMARAAQAAATKRRAALAL